MLEDGWLMSPRELIGLVEGPLLKVSGTTCSLPALCSMVKLNSAIDIHQRASLDCLGEVEVSH